MFLRFSVIANICFFSAFFVVSNINLNFVKMGIRISDAIIIGRTARASLQNIKTYTL